MFEHSNESLTDVFEKLRLEHHLPPIFWITDTPARSIEGFGPLRATLAWAAALELSSSRNDRSRWEGIIARWQVTLSATTPGRLS